LGTEIFLDVLGNYDRQASSAREIEDGEMKIQI
jgi:hypothetical protein